MLPRCIFFNSYIMNVMHHGSRVHISFPIDFLKISLSLYTPSCIMNFTHHEFSLSTIRFIRRCMDEPHLLAHTITLIKVFPCIRVVCFLLTCTFFSTFFRSITRHDDSAKLFYFISFGTCVVFAWSIYPEIYLLSLLAQQISFSFYD